MMRVSLNEIETTTRKAAVGAGYPVGLAQDISAATVWLSARGRDGIEPFLNAVSKPFASIGMPELDSGHIRIKRCDVAASGPSAIDFAIANPKATVHLDAVDQPLLLAAMAAVAQREHELTLTVLDQDGNADTVEAIKAGPAKLSVSVDLEKGRAARLAMPTNGAQVDGAMWQCVLDLAAKTYVPASEASRSSGAGAGLLDND